MKNKCKPRKRKPIPQSSSDESDEHDDDSGGEVLEYQWSQVLSLSYEIPQHPIKHSVQIDVDSYIDDVKGAVGRPNDKWSYIFTPEQFDKNIDISQFQAQPLGVEDLQHYGAKASVIRKQLLERAFELFSENQELS